MNKHTKYIAFGFFIILFVVGLVMLNFGILTSDFEFVIAGFINGGVGFMGFVSIGIDMDIL